MSGCIETLVLKLLALGICLVDTLCSGAMHVVKFSSVAPYGIWAPRTCTRQPHTHMGSPYRYTHMGSPICVWVKYAFGLEQPQNFYLNFNLLWTFVV